MTDNLRDRIAAAACGATSAGKLFPWDTLSETQRDSWRKMADAVIRELGLEVEDGECGYCQAQLPCSRYSAWETDD